MVSPSVAFRLFRAVHCRPDTSRLAAGERSTRGTGVGGSWSATGARPPGMRIWLAAHPSHPHLVWAEHAALPGNRQGHRAPCRKAEINAGIKSGVIIARTARPDARIPGGRCGAATPLRAAQVSARSVRRLVPGDKAARRLAADARVTGSAGARARGSSRPLPGQGAPRMRSPALGRPRPPRRTAAVSHASH